MFDHALKETSQTAVNIFTLDLRQCQENRRTSANAFSYTNKIKKRHIGCRATGYTQKNTTKVDRIISVVKIKNLLKLYIIKGEIN